ncbi:NAD(P)-binding protein [Annulohypoxylon moriforme]|nr:NAD(P)-binding protein [Annulohypoxylon moriforme]
MATVATDLPFDTPPEERATIRAVLWRQFFVTPPLVRDVDLQGKTAIVTGSNGGLGFECARQLLDLGLSKLILAVRDELKGQKAATKLLSGRQLPDDTIEIWKLDLLSYDLITAFAERTKTLKRLDIAVLNAGVFKQKYEMAQVTPSISHEETIQLNVLSNTLLAILLLPSLKPRTHAEPPGRLAVVSSDVASWAKFNEKDNRPLLPAFDKPETFQSWDRYCTSKLISQLLIVELAKKVSPSVAIITLPSPGLTYGTNFGRLPGFHPTDWIGDVLKRIFGRPASVGARTLTAGVTKFGLEAHGQFVEDCKLEPLAPFAYTPESAHISKALWDETMAELSFAHPEKLLNELGMQS